MSPVALNLYRYMLPAIVQLDLPLGVQNGSWNLLKFTFFNGESIYDSYWYQGESQAHAFMLRAYDIKKKYKDCFTSLRPEMLVPTERAGLCANKFPGKNRTLWTLYNQRYTTLSGPLLALDHVNGATYFDVWNNRPLLPKIANGKAVISMRLGPQGIGCVSQVLP